jgi:cation:H+ antiporter
MTFSNIELLVGGLILLVVGADWLVKGASCLASAFGISPLIIGLTVVAYGTSAPELAVSVSSAFKGQADLAIGNVIGSNIFNVLFILGVAAMVTPLVVNRQLVRLDVPVMIAASFLLFALGYDGKIGKLDGLILFSGAIAYTLYLVYESRKEQKKAGFAELAEVPVEEGGHWLGNLGWIAIGLVALVVGSRLLVDSAVSIAQFYGVSELIIGLTIVAAGTSLPEVATSVVAALKGERDIAVGNVVGSSIFNIIAVLGLSSLVSPSGIAVTEQALAFDLPVMIAVAVACLPIFFAGYSISRLNGAIFFGFYISYVLYLIFNSAGHTAVKTFQTAFIYGVAPLTVLSLIYMTAVGVRNHRAAA